MRTMILVTALFSVLAAGCSGAVVDRVRGEEPTASATPIAGGGRPDDTTNPIPAPDSQALVASINGCGLTGDDLAWIESTYGLTVDSGDYWYDPVSGAWGYWGGPTAGFLPPGMDLGYAPIDASGGGTGVVLNGRELHPQDRAGLEQLLGPISPSYYWLDAGGYYGYEGGLAIGNLIYIAQGVGSGGGGGYYDSTYFGNIGSDGQSSYFYDSSTGCSVMSDGVSC